MHHWKKVWRLLKSVFVIYLVYVLFTAVFIFLKDYEVSESGHQPIDTSQYYGETIGTDRAALIEDRQFALTTRVNLLENAKDSVKIANYSIYPGEVSDLFYGLILETANRGVDIQLLYNGIAHNLHGLTNQTYWALVNHPNIELRFYEPLNLLKPWTFNNRMHDKFWLIDDTFALSGGRNLGDKYYIENYDGDEVYDRDVLIYNPNAQATDSVLIDFNAYFGSLWSHEYTQVETANYWRVFQEQAASGEEKLLQNLNTARAEEAHGLGETIHWEEITHPTNNVSLVTNPLERMKKTPILLETLNALMMEAEQYVLAQSPYLVINEELQSILDLEYLEADVHILTNSQYSTPNLAAMAGMLKYNDRLLDGSSQVYGYQGEGSIHGKSYVIDQRLSLVGSFNLDPRSAFLSTENLVIIDSEPLTENLTQNIQTTMAESRIYDEETSVIIEDIQEPKEVSLIKKLLIGFARVLFYPFDELL